MATCQMVVHEIQKGDTLYRLAKQYRTTVPLILLANPGINPYNLQIGSKIKICKGNQFVEKPSLDEMQLLSDMNEALYSGLGWLKLYLVSLFQDVDRQREASENAVNAADELIDIYGVFYPAAMTGRMKDLFAEGFVRNLLAYGGALKNRDMDAAARFEAAARENGNQVAGLLAGQNTFYNAQKLEDGMEALLENVKSIVTDAQNSDTEGEFMGYKNLDKATAMAASYLADGLIRSFYKEG